MDPAQPRTFVDAVRAAWRGFDDYLARWPWAPTVDGLAWLILTMIILVQGWIRGFNLVVFIATFLLAMWALNGLSALLFHGRNLRFLKFRRRFSGAVHAGCPVHATVEVHNSSSRTISGLRLIDGGTNHRQVIGIHELPRGSSAAVNFQIVPERRGYYEWRPLNASTAYPFGLFRRSLVVPPEEKTTLVLPMLGKLDDRQFRRWLRTSQRIANQLTRERPKRSMAPADFYGIRSYRSGDSPRWIHWRTTARVGQPMVREFEEPPQQHLTVILEAWLPDTGETLMEKWRQARQENIETIQLLIATLGNPTPEQRAKKEAELARKEAPHRQPFDLLEQAVSLAATLAWAWTRKLGSNVTIGIVDAIADQPQVFEATAALRSVFPLMERLARVQGGPQPHAQHLINQLQHRKIPRGPMVLLSTHASTLHKQISQSLGRPVQLLDVSQSSVERFFTTQARGALEE